MKSGLLLDVVVGEGPSVLKLLASEDQPLLVRGDALLVLDLGLDVLDGVGGLDLKGDGLASQGLDEDLHLSAKQQYSSMIGCARLCMLNHEFLNFMIKNIATNLLFVA